ncbi:MAG: hypothetical protein DCF27_10740 [Lysobacteraceae bacterium]|nr:MAG: hypothetical protein DCF27_10740 [Xanthomonadaceae bacterium]
MRIDRTRSTLALALALCLPFTAAHAASAEKVEELMDVLDVKGNVVQMQGLMAKMVDDSFRARAQQEGLTAAQMSRTQAMNDAMSKAFAQMMAWETLGPRYSAIYQEVLTDAEIDGALAYYRSPAGASMQAKQPVLMERSMKVGQSMAMEMMPKLQAEIEKAMVEAAAPAPAPAKE